MVSSVIVPLAFWNNSYPTFRISSICISPNTEKLVTGSYTGQLCLWELNLEVAQIIPKNILLSHEHSVTCIVCSNEFFISSSEGGEICRWNLDDGYCCKKNKFRFINRSMQLFTRSLEKDELLFACGDYSEIFIFHSFTLQIIFILNSKSNFDWISNFHVVASEHIKSDIISGITNSGCIKFWVIDELKNDSQCEINSKILQVENAVDLKFSPTNMELLIVSFNYWTLFDSEFLNCICKVKAWNEEKLLGGNFCKYNVVVWTNFGKFLMYDLKDNKYELMHIILDDCNKSCIFHPSMIAFNTQNFIYFVRGDSHGRINICQKNSQKKEMQLLLSSSLKDNWVTCKNSFFNNFLINSSATCSILITELDKFIIGCFDGTIVSFSATQSLMSFYFNQVIKQPLIDVLYGHNGRINCILYPHEKYSYFNKMHLVSGGSDFSVCLWNIITGELLYKFCVHGGEIIRLLVPPSNCNTQVKYSICSISSDHSVAVLNLETKRCIILASRHEYPVVSVHWKPLDDFILIECFDGAVYVWQIETRHLDRILYGVTAQEVVYGCSDLISDSTTWNFYINEEFTTKKLLKREIFQIQKGDESSSVFKLHGFLTNERSESHIFVCNLENISSKIRAYFNEKPDVLECATSQGIYLLTQPLHPDLNEKPLTVLDNIPKTKFFNEQFENKGNDSISAFNTTICPDSTNNTSALSETVFRMLQFFISFTHVWGLNPSIDKIISSILGILKPNLPLPMGVISQSGAYSLFLTTNSDTFKKSPSLVASVCLGMSALSKLLEIISIGFKSTGIEPLKHWSQEKFLQFNAEKWSEVASHFESFYQNSKKDETVTQPRIEIIANAFQSKCSVLRKIFLKLLSNYLQALDKKERNSLLQFWYQYLPHFKILDKTSSERIDFENTDLKTVSLILFGTTGSELKFKSIDSDCQENYIYQTCASFINLMILPNEEKTHFCALQSIAIDFLAHGYIFWEQFLKMDEIVPLLFQMCRDYLKSSSEFNDIKTTSNTCITALNALKAIAVARTAAFINCLIIEIRQSRSNAQHSDQLDHFSIENSKPEILSVIIFLLEKSPYIMQLYLNDVISIFLYCIDSNILKQENLSNLIPVMKKFRQVHHSIKSQKIAVGLANGFLFLHDLRSGKAHEIIAHKDSVSVLKFSEDGKFLASYSCYENRLSFWQILSSIFGLGKLQLKCYKSYDTYPIRHEEEIRNHFEIASLDWSEKRSVTLNLFDGTSTTFHI